MQRASFVRRAISALARRFARNALQFA